MRIRNHIPDVLTDKGIRFKLYAIGLPLREVIKEVESKGLHYRVISVLSRNLRAKTDLFGYVYKPHEYVFAEDRD